METIGGSYGVAGFPRGSAEIRDLMMRKRGLQEGEFLFLVLTPPRITKCVFLCVCLCVCGGADGCLFTCVLFRKSPVPVCLIIQSAIDIKPYDFPLFIEPSNMPA